MLFEKKPLKLFIIFNLFCLFTSSCRKYEEGPAISLLSKKYRLYGYWDMEKYIKNNVEQTSELQFHHQFGFAKDGTYYYSFYDPPSGYTINFTGTWEFRHQKQQLVLGLDDPINGMEYQVWDILRLTSKELWLETVSPGMMVEWHLTAH
jgi:hypothetical protein